MTGENSTVRETRLKEIRERYEATTQGPWFYNGYSAIWAAEVSETSAYREKYHTEEDAQEQLFGTVHPERLEGGGDLCRCPETGANADFVAEAHQDIPWLLTQLADLERDREAMEKVRQAHPDARIRDVLFYEAQGWDRQTILGTQEARDDN